MFLGLFGLVYLDSLCPLSPCDCAYIAVLVLVPCSHSLCSLFSSSLHVFLHVPSLSLPRLSLCTSCVTFKVHILVSAFSVLCPPHPVKGNCPQLCSLCASASLITCVFMPVSLCPMSHRPSVLCVLACVPL